ncbi:FAD-dependent oxidoreductase [Caenimonas sedimenti]|uniref:FAD-dependent oxidoreductase n=1 Tax=Caenimonas sedimenti TaxID=2596921 RepID=A0A562ZMA1_9BURK|nr:FAD-dependent monooxygenase [Caenimonas sedimenti]TWO69547.1 FAD-dependent oxidoreductase [Caenimonas sedimenti]
MSLQILIAGGGIGGLGAALAACRAGWAACLFEQAEAFSETGAGIQLGPNAGRVLQGWGLADALDRVASRPARIRVRSGVDGAELAALPLDDFASRYGAPYRTVHRADLHGVLLGAAQAEGAALNPATRIERVETAGDVVRLHCSAGPLREGDALAGADGLWSTVRAAVHPDAAPRFTGDLAFRALALQQDLAQPLRSDEVCVWLAPQLHVVAYPLRGQHWLNVVVVAAGAKPQALAGWDHEADATAMRSAVAGACAPLRALLDAMPAWRMWPVHETAPLHGADGMASGRIALLGDAAHPMRPYLAQGAGMALEDAAELGRMLAMARDAGLPVETALRRYALHRWERCAKVQARSQRNGVIFHASGPLRVARDAAMRVAGGRLLDNPWLYRG